MAAWACSQSKPEDVKAHFDRGVAFSKKGDLDGGIVQFREAIRLKPDFAEAHDQLGVALAHKGDLDGAIAEYRRLITGTNPGAKSGSGRLHRTPGKR